MKTIFKQMDENDFKYMNIVLNDNGFDETTKRSNYVYWQKRVNGRLEQLQPLISELQEKNISLLSLSKELNEEVIELNNVKLFYNL